MNKLAAVPDLALTPLAVVNAVLPATYEAARLAIAECDRIDECKTWADKAAALASYARQAKDDSLAVMARRIQARAERRAGELLKLIPRADDSTRFGREGDRPPMTRTQAATDAGLSEHQRKTALRIAAVPESQFNRQVESAKPPTVTQLADQGREMRAASAAAPSAVHTSAPEVCKAVADFASACGQIDATKAGLELTAREAAEIRKAVTKIDNWLDRLMNSLPPAVA
jgi:hypothetical protein